VAWRFYAEGLDLSNKVMAEERRRNVRHSSGSVGGPVHVDSP
jgi:hypothetical protein